jgi:hypothetical protein|tara:strand:- start:1020 stop:2231 length:1212 start_codon:yes stop_codon:yes gene_type:complete
MGFFSKIFKGVKKVFKKIGKGIKSAFAKVGKFMGKLGIIGQIGLGLLLPGIGGMLGKWAVTAMGSSSAIVSAAGHFVNAAVQIGTKVGSVFKTVTQGVTNVIGETVGAALNKVGLDGVVLDVTKSLGINAGQGINISQKGFGSIMKVASNSMVEVAKAGGNLFSMDTLTGMNKYGAQALAKANAIGPNLTDEPIMSRIEIPEAPAPQMSALDAGDTTGLIAPTDNIITQDISSATALGQTLPPAGSAIVTPEMSQPFEIIKGEGIADSAYQAADSSVGVDSLLAQPDEKGFFEKVYDKGVAEVGEFTSDPFKGSSEKFRGAITSKGLQTLGLEPVPEFTQNRFSSTVVLPDMDSTAIRTGRGMAFNPMEYASNENYFALNPYGYSAQQNNLNQLYLNELGSRV